MIPVGVGDHRTVDGLPRIDVEIAGFAVQPALGETEERHCSKCRGLRGTRGGRRAANGEWRMAKGESRTRAAGPRSRPYMGSRLAIRHSQFAGNGLSPSL